MSKIFEGLDKAASRQIQNIVRQNPKGSADEKMLLQRYIKTPMVQDFNLSAEEWIGQATKWLAVNQNNIKKNYPEVDTSDLISLATKMYEDFLAMQGKLEEDTGIVDEGVLGPAIGGLTGYNLASDDPSDPNDIGTSWRIPGLGSEDDIPSALGGMYAGNKLQNWLKDPENRDKLKRKFGPGASATDVVPEVPVNTSGTRQLSQDPKNVRRREQRAAAKAAQSTEKPATDKPRARVNQQTGALEPVQTDTPKPTKPKTTRTPKVTPPKSSYPSLDAEPGRTIGGGYQDVRWRTAPLAGAADAVDDVAKVAKNTPIGRKLGALGAAAGIVGGIGSQMYAGIEDKFKDLLGKEDDKPAPNKVERLPRNVRGVQTRINKHKARDRAADDPDLGALYRRAAGLEPGSMVGEPPESQTPPPQSSQPAVEPESDILGAPGADTAERTTPLDGPTGGRPPIGTSSEPDILGAPGADVSEPNGPIDRDRSRDRSVDIPLPPPRARRPSEVVGKQPEMPFENTDGIPVPQPTGGAVKKVAKTVGKSILPAAGALTFVDDLKDFQGRIKKGDYPGAALRAASTGLTMVPHFGAQAIGSAGEAALAAYDNPQAVKDYFKNYKPTSSIGRGIKEGYSAGAVGGIGLGEGDKPPKAGFNKNPHKVGPGTSKDDYEYKKFIPRDRKEKGEEWAIARDVKNVNSKLGKKKPKELNTGFYKNYLGNRPVREDEIDEAGGRLGAINTVAQLFKSIAKGGDPVDMDIQQRQINALMRKYNIDYKDIGIKKPTPQQSTTSPPSKPGAYKSWIDTLPTFDDPSKGSNYKKWEPDPIEENDMDEGISSVAKMAKPITKRIDTMRRYFAGDETARDPTDTSIQRAWFADPKNQYQIQRPSTPAKTTKNTVMTPEDEMVNELSPKAINAFLDKASAAVRSGRPEPAKVNPVTGQTAPPGWKVAAGKIAKPGSAMDHYAKVKAIDPNKVPVKEYDANLIKHIASANKIKDPNLIYPGQKLTLPGGVLYTIKPGDNLTKIANLFLRQTQRPEEPMQTVTITAPRPSSKYPDSGLEPGQTFSDPRNNPGNIRFVKNLNKPGYVLDKAIGADKNGFAVFATPEDGLDAMRRQLAIYARKGFTGREMLHKYAPPSDNNDTDRYVKNTFGELGLDPDQPLDPKLIPLIQPLMVRQEHGKEGMQHYFPDVPTNNMIAQVNEMEILQRFLDRNADKNKQDKPVPNPNAVYKKPGAPKSAPHDISQPEEPVEIPGHPLERDRPKLDAEVQKRMQQLQPQKTKESSILKGIKGR